MPTCHFPNRLFCHFVNFLNLLLIWRNFWQFVIINKYRIRWSIDWDKNSSKKPSRLSWGTNVKSQIFFDSKLSFSGQNIKKY
jgi:hypothetical protein